MDASALAAYLDRIGVERPAVLDAAALSGRTLIRTSGGARAEQDLGPDDAVLAAYREHFGVVLDRVPVRAGAA
jgi:hypothetical protein